MFPLRPPFMNFPFNNYYNYRRPTYYQQKMYSQNIYKNNIPSQGNTFISNENPQNFDIPSNFENVNSSNSSKSKNSELNSQQKKTPSEPFDDYFFEVFGLKLYFDDILLICLLFFLYEEGVKDQELFISLILLLLS